MKILTILSHLGETMWSHKIFILICVSVPHLLTSQQETLLKPQLETPVIKEKIKTSSETESWWNKIINAVSFWQPKCKKELAQYYEELQNIANETIRRRVNIEIEEAGRELKRLVYQWFNASKNQNKLSKKYTVSTANWGAHEPINVNFSQPLAIIEYDVREKNNELTINATIKALK